MTAPAQTTERPAGVWPTCGTGSARVSHCLCQRIRSDADCWQSGDPTAGLPVAPAWTPGGNR